MMMTAGASSLHSPSSSMMTMAAGGGINNQGSCTLRPRSNDSVMPMVSIRQQQTSSGNYLCQQQQQLNSRTTGNQGIHSNMNGSGQASINPLFELDVRKYLIYKNPGEDGPEIKGGPPDALLVKATEVTKNGNYISIHYILLFTNLIPQRLTYLCQSVLMLMFSMSIYDYNLYMCQSMA